MKQNKQCAGNSFISVFFLMYLTFSVFFINSRVLWSPFILWEVNLIFHTSCMSLNASFPFGAYVHIILGYFLFFCVLKQWRLPSPCFQIRGLNFGRTVLISSLLERCPQSTSVNCQLWVTRTWSRNIANYFLSLCPSWEIFNLNPLHFMNSLCKCKACSAVQSVFKILKDETKRAVGNDVMKIL